MITAVIAGRRSRPPFTRSGQRRGGGYGHRPCRWECGRGGYRCIRDLWRQAEEWSGGGQITFWRVCGWFLFGSLYCGLEILWRGYSHWTMGVLAAAVSIPLDIANDTVIPWKTPLWLQAIIGGTIITAAEFVTGCIVNLWLGWGVWDYSRIPFNLLGQVCLRYWVVWVALSLPAIVMFDFMAHWAGRGPCPHYKLF